ncbi:hypothetical protein FKM82_012266, partial [Ascaphus truei]
MRHCSLMFVGNSTLQHCIFSITYYFKVPWRYSRTQKLIQSTLRYISTFLFSFSFLVSNHGTLICAVRLDCFNKMDDLVVLDLLECPVCLGKLNVTAKVLPCQHTFCQPCLQRLFKARKELRCPECRTPVFCSIEELPANFLLVRLLEGIKGGQTFQRNNSFRRAGGLFAQDSFHRSREHKAKHESPHRLFPKARMAIEGVPCAKALNNYKGHAPNDLTFNKGDIIVLRRQVDENWYQGEVNRGSGIFPASSVKVLQQFQQPPALCKALYNFELKDKEGGENKDCLTFMKQNHTAKQLLESSKNKRNNNLVGIPSLLKKSPSKAKASESPTIRRTPEGRRKSPRQFSITNALNTFNKMVHSPVHRQTPEIGTPVLISSSNPAIIEKAESLSNAPIQGNGSLYHATLGTLGPGPTLVTFPISQQNIVPNVCVALQPYIAHGPEEIDLQKGEGVRVLGKFQEGWLRGVSLVTGKIGVFPSHCVIPIYSRKTSNYPDPRLPSHPNTWISSNTSVSSQSSLSENGAYRPVRSFFVPTAVVEPVKKNTTSSAAMTPMSLRRGSNSIKKSSSLQRKVHSSPLGLAMTSIARSPSAIVQPQPFETFQNATHCNVGASCETWSRLNPPYESLAFVGRGVDSKRHSTASSVILEAKEPLAKTESPVKPSTSAPPSILVKPDTPKSSSEK